MDIKSGWIARAGALWNEGGPWGGRGKGSGDSGSGSEGGPQNPWAKPLGGNKPRGPGRASAVDELGQRLKDRFGGGGGGGGFSGGSFQIGSGGMGPLLRNAAIILGGLWIILTSVHRIEPQEEGVVTRFGKYSGRLEPGIGLTLPAPIERVQKVDVQEIQTLSIPDAEGENLILTGDQNIIDLAYSVRWIKNNPELFLFQLAKPEETIQEVAESAMREVMSQMTLSDAFGPGRSQIEQRVAERMQTILKAYHSGVTVRGVAIKRADPPSDVIEAFKLVTVKQQEKQANINNANTYAQQVIAKAEGDATAFDKVYEQYRLAPGVTRKRMYYDTMEAVLANTDKTIVEPNAIAPYLPLGNQRPRVSVEEPGK